MTRCDTTATRDMRQRHATATRDSDTLRYSARVRDTAPERVTQRAVRARQGPGQRHGRPRPRYGRARPAIRRHCSPRHSSVSARSGCSARSLGAPCAQPGSVGCAPVHPTQFWTQCTFSVTVWHTIHKIFQKNNKIKFCNNEIFKKK